MTPDRSGPRFVTQRLREPVNALTHAVGVVLSLAATAVLLTLSWGHTSRLIAFAIYGLSSVSLYTASTLLHGLRAGPVAQRWLRRLDHAAVFVLIAGSYTPIALVTLRPHSPAWGWSLLAVVWGLAVLGVVFKLVWFDAPRWLSTGLYLLLGWMALVAIVPIARAMPAGGLVWLVIGGLFYSVGAVVYMLRRPDPIPKVLGYHELWHLFVLAGGASHFVMLLRYVLPT
jgi:hemolysin III